MIEWLKDRIPEGWEAWTVSLATLVAVGLVGLLAHAVLYRILGRIAERTDTKIDDSVVVHSRGPAKLLLPLLAVSVVLPSLSFSSSAKEVLGRLLSLVLIAAVAWLALRALRAMEDLLSQRYDIEVADNLEARRVLTQVRVLAKIAAVVVLVLALATMLMTFDRVRQLGTSILASAGIVGIIVGVAAQRTIGNFIAGLQIALSQPFRIDDVVIVEGEWGRIEEINLTYVVIRIWDLRRLVVPVSYFIEKPFQNWTRASAELLGTAFFYVDYSVPVGETRDAFRQILESSERWDGASWALQVTNLTERTVELRALMSARDAPTAFELRCEVRERLLAWLHEQYPHALPKARAELKSQLPAAA